ncbi:MAG TPA: beta-propeller fold lactonase family protein [Candidatus Acidoferrum sp.]|nr:beta-propeller fold lactonase family protein [Candidatus Acidoferrum sp.]
MYATTNSAQILTFPIDRTTGSLGAPTSIAGPANSGGLLTLAPANVAYQVYLYVSDPQDGAIHVYPVNMADGTLAPAHMGPSLGNGAGTPGEMAAFGNIIYVASSTGSIFAFTENADGSLTSVAGSPFAAGAGASHLAAVSFGTPNTSFLYTSNTNDPNGSISAFSITTSGGLVPVAGSPFPTLSGAGPGGFYSQGKSLYVALKNANAVAAFAIANDGSLTPIAGSPFPAGRGTFSLNRSGGFLLATNNLDGTISSYSIDSTGILTPVAGSPFPGTVTSGDTTSDLNGKLFVPNATSNSIDVFLTDINGAISPMVGSPFQAGASPVALTTAGFPAVDPPGPAK